MYEAFFSFTKLMTTRTTRRTSLTSSLKNRFDRAFLCVQVDSELMIRRTFVRDTFVNLLIFDIFK